MTALEALGNRQLNLPDSETALDVILSAWLRSVTSRKA